MKFRVVRIVSGFCAVFFILWAVELFIDDIQNYNRLLQSEFRKYMARDVIVLGFGVFCLIRFRHWHRRAQLAEKRGKDSEMGR